MSRMYAKCVERSIRSEGGSQSTIRKEEDRVCILLFHNVALHITFK